MMRPSRFSRPEVTISIAVLLSFLIGIGGFIFAAIRARSLTDTAIIIPRFTIDDRIYNVLISSPTTCLHNLTSNLNEGSCRSQPLWSLAHLFYRPDSLDIVAIGLRLILLVGVGVALFFLNQTLSRRTKQLPQTTAIWLASLMLATPLPLLLLGSGRQLVDASLILNTFAWPANLFSIFMSIVCTGGLYKYQSKTSAWPIIGLLAGIWILLHPYFVFFWLTLTAIWLIKSQALAKNHLIRSATLVLPALMVGGCYAWLQQTNAFFRYQLSSNVTPYDPATLPLLILGACASIILTWYTLRRDGISAADLSRLLGPYLLTWLTVAGIWQLIPTSTWRRSTLILLVPLALAAACIAAYEPARTFRRYLLAVIVTNLVILCLTSYRAQLPYLEADLRPVTVTANDIEASAYLEHYQDQYFIGSTWAIARFPWLSHTHLLNTHPQESPDYLKWNALLQQTSSSQASCDSAQKMLKDGQITGIILDNPTSQTQINYFRKCGSPVRFQNNDWIIISPPPAN